MLSLWSDYLGFITWFLERVSQDSVAVFPLLADKGFLTDLRLRVDTRLQLGSDIQELRDCRLQPLAVDELCSLKLLNQVRQREVVLSIK